MVAEATTCRAFATACRCKLVRSLPWAIAFFEEDVVQSQLSFAQASAQRADELRREWPGGDRFILARNLFCAALSHGDPLKLKMAAEFAEAWEDDEFAGAGGDGFVLHVPGVLMRDVDGV